MENPTTSNGARQRAGATVDESTGEILAAESAELVPADDASRYAALSDKCVALEMARDDWLGELAAGGDETLTDLERDLSAAQRERAAILERWRKAFAHARPGTAIDAPRVRVLKPKPRTTWRLDKSARDVSSTWARDELATIIERMLADGATVDDAADAIIAWLGPTRTEGRQPDLRVTVRPPNTNTREGTR